MSLQGQGYLFTISLLSLFSLTSATTVFTYLDSACTTLSQTFNVVADGSTCYVPSEQSLFSVKIKCSMDGSATVQAYSGQQCEGIVVGKVPLQSDSCKSVSELSPLTQESMWFKVQCDDSTGEQQTDDPSTTTTATGTENSNTDSDNGSNTDSNTESNNNTNAGTTTPPPPPTTTTTTASSNNTNSQDLNSLVQLVINSVTQDSNGQNSISPFKLNNSTTLAPTTDSQGNSGFTITANIGKTFNGATQQFNAITIGLFTVGAMVATLL